MRFPKKKQKKDQKEEIKELLKQLEAIDGVKVLKGSMTPEELAKDLKSMFDSQSAIASDWYTWLTETPTKKDWNTTIPDEFHKEAIVISGLIKSIFDMLEIHNKIDVPKGFSYQVAMMVTTIILREKYPVYAKVAYWRIASDQNDQFKEANLFGKKGSDPDTKDKTYI